MTPPWTIKTAVHLQRKVLTLLQISRTLRNQVFSEGLDGGDELSESVELQEDLEDLPFLATGTKEVTVERRR